MNDRFPIDSDAPIDDPDQDRLGFGDLARHLADVFLHNDLSRGFVVGIEGEWGSGKSSLANLALKALENERENHRLRIVRFSPWIIGNRDQLLGQLFAELDSVLYELLPIDRRDQVRTAFRKYAQGAALLASPLKLAGSMGIPGADLVGNTLESAASLAAQFELPSLSKLNDDLRKKLEEHNGKIIVFIDDLDRLEPQETVEVLRLVRAVADFPKVAYLLAYDPSVLAKSLKAALGVKDGKAYIDKVVQASFTIPDPLSFYLRSWLSEEMGILAKDTIITESVKTRLDRAIGTWCLEYISTPRDVVRLINSLKLFVIPIIEKIDLSDALFVQIIRIHHPNLYYWIERYTKSYFAFHSELHGADIRRIGVDNSGNVTDEFINIIDKTDEDRLRFLIDMRAHLPEISIPDFPRTGHLPQTVEKWAEERRLWSASYFRFYFALSMLPECMSDEELVDFLNQCVNAPKEAARCFDQLCGTVRAQGGNMAEMLLSRIVERGANISFLQLKSLFFVLGETADTFIRNFRSPFGDSIRLHGELIAVFRLVKRVTSGDRAAILKELFQNAASLAWLSGIMWQQASEHGLTNDIPKPVEFRLLTPEEFDLMRTRFLTRLKRARPDQLKGAPLLPGLIEVWCLAGGEEDAKAWVAEQTAEYEGLIDLLDRLSFGHFISQPDDYRHAPKRRMLEILFGSVEEVERRLNAIVSKADAGTDLRENAERLVSAIAAKQQTDEKAG